MIDLYALAKEKDDEEPRHFRWRIFKLMRFDGELMWRELNSIERDNLIPYRYFFSYTGTDPQEALTHFNVCVCYLGEFDYFNGYRKVPFNEKDLLEQPPQAF